jgi:hypothetical protein
MATRVSENPEVESHYVTQAALSATLLAALRRLWPTINPMSAPQNMSIYRDGVAGLVEQFAQASISLSADYYEALRAEAGINTAFRTPIVDPPPRTLVDAGLDWAMAAQSQMDADIEEMQRRVDAAMQKAVADAGRSEVAAAVAGDESALGFARVAKPGACAFCLLQAIRKTRPKEGAPSRPGVYKTRDTAGRAANENFTGSGLFKFHDNCHCVVVPVFTFDYELEPHLVETEALYEDATVNSKRGESLNDFRRALAALRRGDELPTSSPQAPSGTQSGADHLAALLGRIADFGA